MKDIAQQADKRRWWRRRWRLKLSMAGVLLAAALWAVQHHVAEAGERYCTAVAAAPVVDCILVPGARIHADGRPYSMLEDRLLTALELFQLGKAPRIVVSGRGGGGLAVDEVGAMRRWLQGRGVPVAAIVDDAEGLRTIDSLRRCRDVVGVHSVVVVTNEFHLGRAVFLGRQCGLEAHGVSAAAQYNYSTYVMAKNRGREVLARARAFVDAYLLGACN